MREKVIFTHLPMNYGREYPDIIGEGKIDGYAYKIKNIKGSHPTAYVKLPLDHVFFDKFYDDIPVYVHGGLTYSEKEEDGYWIGWDYAHCGDYTSDYVFGDKQWTTDEILDHVEDVIKQLKHIDAIEKSDALKRHIDNYKQELIKMFLDIEDALKSEEA